MNIDIVATALMGFFAFTGVGAAPVASPPPVEVPAISVLATAYNPVAEQTNEDPLITASGLPSNPEVVAARSRDLTEMLPFGTIIALEAPAYQNRECGFDKVSDQIGYRVILDVMHARKKQQVDIMFDQHNHVPLAGTLRNPAEVLGVCEGVTVRVVGHVDLKNVPQTQIELIRLVEGEKLARK